MSLSMSDMVRFQALELRVAELEKKCQRCSCDSEPVRVEIVVDENGDKRLRDVPRRGRPPKNLEDRMKAQEHDPIDA